ncbi:hypothetical protein BDV23DRAFT_185509 [Aspergillus alliaceus]|uniref:AB hydrolase-1 domain-containing protein n=1 Tax=Petromyces alliaceus TaxID=209559 RepID=A0A5N7C2I1_PETAA|nr:hypothetical protein BDV23DRAFT_185509 [Aspergillus alliaceus]
MFASRYLGILLHTLAERAGVRLLVVDRSGMGASTDPIPKFSRVNLVSHGAGTIYLLNIKAQCRDVGKPNPVLTFLAPGVDPTHSRVTAIQMAQYVTTKAFAAWYHIPRFFVLQASPALQCLRKDDVSSWGGCSDYAACAKMLAAGEASREG